MDPPTNQSPTHAWATPDEIASLDSAQNLGAREKKESDDQVSVETEEVTSENTWIAWLQVLGVIKPIPCDPSSFLLCWDSWR